MHEWVLAEAITETIVARAREHSEKVFKSLRIVIGKLRQIDKDILLDALSELLKIAGIEVREIIFVEEDIVVECSRCGYRWNIDLDVFDKDTKEFIHFIPEVLHTYVSCPMCKSHDFKIISGHSISIDLR